jgi:hypothetical protein
MIDPEHKYHYLTTVTSYSKIKIVIFYPKTINPFPRAILVCHPNHISVPITSTVFHITIVPKYFGI